MPRAQAWVDKFVGLYKHQVPAGAWIAYTAVKAWANAVARWAMPTTSRP
jgi:ABC-type branched-subunit amino acid transport system substrate-binding protein